jgi:serine/threonine-protein kinase
VPDPLKITLVPVWAGGADELNPIYVSPAAGKPSQMLTAVAGGEEGVRFADGCGGALAVDSSGLTVTALQITPECTLRASVGNFTDLQSPAFSITSRESAD